MISIISHDNAGTTGIELGDTQGKVNSFTSRAGIHDVAELRLKGIQQLLRIVKNVFAHVTRVSIERGNLAGDRLNHCRITVAD